MIIRIRVNQNVFWDQDHVAGGWLHLIFIVTQSYCSPFLI